MPRFSRAYKSQLMTAADLAEGDISVVIKDARDQLVGQGANQKTKVVLTFRDHDQQLALNATNYKAIVSMFGQDLDEWVGRNLQLTVGEATYGGETVDAVRVKAPTRRTSRTTPSSAADVRYPSNFSSRIQNLPRVEQAPDEEEEGGSSTSPF